MGQNQDNRKRAFSEIVSIEAWHSPFSQEGARADLHADVVFGEGRVGGELESKVRFRLRLRRADLVIVVPETEPLAIDKASVSRDNSAEISGSKVTHITRGAALSGSASLEAVVAASGPSLNASVASKAEFNSGAGSRVEASELVKAMKIKQSLTAEGHYRWEIKPQLLEYLDGRPWAAATEPRLTLIDKRADRSKGIPPMVRIEIRCLREDLEISDVEIKDKAIWTKLKGGMAFENKKIAAEAYIRNRLCAEGLEFGDISDPFGQLVLAHVSAEPN